jgi:hypothetical protein
LVSVREAPQSTSEKLELERAEEELEERHHEIEVTVDGVLHPLKDDQEITPSRVRSVCFDVRTGNHRPAVGPEPGAASTGCLIAQAEAVILAGHLKQGAIAFAAGLALAR